jgi:hypothetical protein
MNVRGVRTPAVAGAAGQPGAVACSTTAQSRDPLNLDNVAFRRCALHQALILLASIAAVETCPMSYAASRPPAAWASGSASNPQTTHHECVGSLFEGRDLQIAAEVPPSATPLPNPVS